MLTNKIIIFCIFIIFILTIAAVEVAVGLALIININRLRGGISMDMIQLLKK
jgi:NADH:ubiquinone oxidoreductase subunit K